MKQDEVLRILEGSYDLHTHPIPSHVPRCLDDFELVEQAASYQMAGVMIKNHYESTAARAALVNRRMSHLCTRAYGGVVIELAGGRVEPLCGRECVKARSLLCMDAHKRFGSLPEKRGYAGRFFYQTRNFRY